MKIPYKCRNCKFAYKSLNKKYIKQKGIRKWDYGYFCLWYENMINDKTIEECSKVKNQKGNLTEFLG